MANEITTHTADEATPSNTLAMIARAVSDPNVSVEKMVELNNLHERIMDRAAKQDYVRAFAAAMMEMPTISKKGAILNNSGKVQSRFARWEDLDRITRPILKRHGLILSFELSEAAGKALAVTAVLTHVGGHQERGGPMPMPVDTSGAKNATQGTGSAMSYAKRYATIAMLNIVTEDDTDGNGAPVENAGAAEKLTYEEAKSVAENEGLSAYSEHFKTRTRAAKLYLTSTPATDGNGTLHDQLKAIAEASDRRAEGKGH